MIYSLSKTTITWGDHEDDYSEETEWVYRDVRGTAQDVINAAEELSGLEPSQHPLYVGQLEGVWLTECDERVDEWGGRVTHSLFLKGSEKQLAGIFRKLGFNLKESSNVN